MHRDSIQPRHSRQWRTIEPSLYRAAAERGGAARVGCRPSFWQASADRGIHLGDGRQGGTAAVPGADAGRRPRGAPVGADGGHV